jgi:membrane-bound serine protease (ClpP class)
MTPGSVIGAATPVMMIPGQGVQELPDSYEEKLSSAMRALIRATAQAKGHNPDVFEAMVDRERGLTIGETVIVEKGKLLTLTNVEAEKQYGEPLRPLLSAGTVGSVDELLKRLGLEQATHFVVEPYGLEVVGRWLTMISPLLILIGFLAIYIEMKTPGIGVPALVALISFGLYFIGYFIAGLAGWEEAVVFGMGVILLAVEVFVLPGFGMTGVLGLGCVLAALVMAMVHRMPGGPVWPGWTELQVPVLKVLGGFLGAAGVMAALARYLPETSLFRKLELGATTSAAAGYTSSRGEAAALVGAIGVAETMLRPSGKGRFGEKLVDVVTEGDLVEAGTAIRIVEVSGSRVVVTREG